MPLFTQHYKLGIKLAHEQYSATLDRARFLTIDNLLGFLGDLIGDGRINGWHMTSQAAYKLRVDSGIGIIDRFAVRTFGPVDITFESDGHFFVWMKRKPGIIGGFSDFSPQVWFLVDDTTAPAAPTGLAVKGTTRNSVVLDWDNGGETDIARYEIFRSLDNTPSGWAAVTSPVAVVAVSAYTDTGLDDETLYYYRVRAVDSTGNIGSYASTSAMTSADLRTPAPVRGLTVFSGNGMLQASWLTSPDSFVTHYAVTLQRLTAAGANDGAPVVATVTADVRQKLFTGLVNGSAYHVTLQAKTKNAILSSPITVSGTPNFNTAPAEVVAVSVTQTWDGSGITLHLSWTPDGSATTPDIYLITVTEGGAATQQIVVRAGTTKAVSLFKFKPIKEQTEYSFRVQGRATNGDTNIGVVQTIVTSKFTPPVAPTVVSLVLANNSHLQINWENPTNAFARVLVSLSRTDLNTQTTTILFTERDAGKGTSLPYDTYTVLLASRYTATVVAEDSFGNRSVPVLASLTLESDVPLPPVPPILVAEASLGYMRVRWEEAEIDNPSFYKVWRAHATTTLTPADFQLLDTVRSDTLEAIDYDVIAGQTYAYIVTTVDSFGNESHGPGDGTLIPDMVLSKLNGQNVLSSPEHVIGSLAGADFTLTWNPASDFFDGWQVYRAVGDLNFTLLAAIPRTQTTYVDQNINIAGGKRHTYIVRKYRNEADVLLTTTAVTPQNSIALGEVLVVAGEVTPDETDAVEIEDIRDPVIEEAQRRIRAHHHQFISDTDDRRIQLGSTVVVSDWTTDDLFVYVTATDIASTDFLNVPFTVYVNDVQTELLYELNPAEGRLTFEEPLFEDDVVKVVYDGVDEVQGSLPEAKIAYLTANNITKDTLDPRTLPPLNHDGRMGEKLRPVTSLYKSNDFQYYFAGNAGNFFGTIGVPSLFFQSTTTRTFYDIIPTADGLLAATSHGVCTSDDFGHSWTRVLGTTRAVTRLVHTTWGDYAAAAGHGVLFASDLLTDWHEFDGLTGVRFVRDICEGGDGRLYATTDVGVFRYDPLIAEPYWTQCALPDYSSSSFYAAFFETHLNAMVVSSEGGLFYSTNGGASWSLWNAFREQRPVFVIFREQNAVFALTDDRLYRKLDTDTYFSQVAFFNDRVRKVVLFNDRLYVSSEAGVYASTGDVFSQASIPFDLTLPQLSEGNNRYVMTTLNVVSGRLLLGTENELYGSTSHGSASLQYRQTGTYAPSVYVDGELRTLGVYTTASTVTFDQRLDPNAAVEVANQYLEYEAEHGGWADVSYASPVRVYYNNVSMNNPGDSRLPDSVSVAGLVIPELTNRNSDLTAATSILAEIEAAKVRVDFEGSPANVASLFNLLTKLEAVIDPSVTIARPDVKVPLYKDEENVATVNTSDGRFTFVEDIIIGGELVGFDGDPFRFTKYSDIRADIRGVTLVGDGDFTHEEIEDQIEERLSGIDAKFARVQQVNLIKSGLFVEKTWPGERADLSPPKQMELFTGCGLSWYDRFNSTIDYALRVRKNPTNVSISYPACVLEVPDREEVWVGGYGGIIAVEKASLASDPTITSVYAAEGRFARHMLLDGDVVYAVVDDLLYTISVSDLSVARDSGIGLPKGVTSVAKAYNNLVVAGADGVYIKRITGVWDRVVEGQEMSVVFLGDLLMAYDKLNNFYSSPSGDAWTAKGDPTPLVLDDPETKTVDESLQGIQPDLKINKALRFKSVFFATSAGLYEDNLTFYSRGIKLKKANVTGDTSEEISVNDIASNGDVLLVGLSDGRYFTYEVTSDTGAFFSHSAASVLDTIHRVAVIDDELWLFGFDKAYVVSQNVVVKLATGRRISWQP